MQAPILLAIGGGGATHGTHPELDQLCLEYSKARPRVGFVGLASGDDPVQYRCFVNCFGPLARGISRLPKDADKARAQDWLDGLDLIYLGGGNPLRLVDHFRASSLYEVFRDAYLRGIPIAGVSAGAMCWFDSFVWRDTGGNLKLADGLGLARGTMTPHSLIEPERIDHLQALADNGRVAHALAVDDGAAIVLGPAGPLRAFPPRGKPKVHFIRGAQPPLGAVE